MVVTAQLPWRRRRRVSDRLTHSPVGTVGAAIILSVALVAVSAPVLATADPTEQMLDRRLLPPAWRPKGRAEHLLGTDSLGRDVFSRLLYGARVSIVVGISAVTLAGGLGVAIGVAAGFVGGWVDSLLMRVADAFLAIPFVVLVLAIVGAVGAGVLTIVLVLGFANWMEYARVVRGDVLAARSRDYVEAAHALGASPVRVAVRHILPNILSSVIVLATLNVATAIIVESALSFLGVGVQPPTVTWGGMLATGRDYVTTAWWLATFPGATIAVTVLGILFIGDWLRSRLDPRVR